MEKVGVKAIFETSEFQRGMAIYNNGVLQINNVTKQAASQSKQSGQQVSQNWEKAFGAIITKVAAVVAAYGVLKKSWQFIEESTLLAARVETLGVALDSVGALAGYSTAQIDEYTKAVEEKGITTQAARQSLLQMAQAEISFSHASDLARISQDAAVIANINSSEAFGRMVYGIQSGQVEILRTMGLNVNFEQSYKTLAATLGITTAELSETDKAQARVQAVMEKGALIAGTYEAAMGTAGKQMKSVERYAEQLQLAVGNIFLEGLTEGVTAVTDVLKDFQEWVDANREELDQLGESVGWLTSALLDLADMDQDMGTLLDSVVAFLTTTIDLLAVGTQSVADFLDAFELLKLLVMPTPLAAVKGLELLGVGEFAKTGAKGVHGLAAESFAERDAQKAQRERERQAKQDEQRRLGEQARIDAEREKQLAKQRETQERAATALSENLDKLQNLQKDYYRNLAKMEADQNKERAKAERDYLKSVEKERAAGAKRLADTTAKYEKQQAKTVEDYRKNVARAEKEAVDQRIQAEQQYALQEKQAKERYNLDRIQGERRFQYEKAKAIAEGDTLAIEELNAQYAMEQQEAQENEALRQQQSGESQEEQIRAAGETAREQLDELRTQLEETLAEQEQAYQEQIADQQTANAERMADMALNYQEQTAMREEQNALEQQQAEENHRRQLEDLGQNLADQEELQELGADKVSQLLEQYYGEDGLADQIMQGWHDRENERIVVTAEMLAGMAAVPEVAGGGEAPYYERPSMMDTGGIVQGPATVRVGAGVVEAFTPLNRGGGGNLSVSWAGGPIPLTGLESASPSNVNDVARALAESLTAKVRVHRRN